ncbi:MAG: VCBS repeat-containing protein [Desulfobacterales bacterium]|nr:MAG: VCBS repeat-containing protein [Desulfobacterales bacterium]
MNFAVTVPRNQRLRSERSLPAQKKPWRQRIPRILGTFDLDGDGRPETLFRQEFDKDYFFGSRINELKLSNGSLKDFRPNIDLPGRFTVLGSLFADLTGDGQLETVFIRGGLLYIYSGKKAVYTSPQQMGGSLSFLTYAVNPSAKNVMFTSASFEISPVVADLDGDGQLELLAVASDRNIVGTLKAAPGIKKSWLSAVKFRDGRFDMGILGEEMDAPVPGLAVPDDRVLFVASKPTNIVGQGGRSDLLAYPLVRP